MEKNLKISRIIGSRDGYDILTESGKFQLTFGEMAKYAGQPRSAGSDIQVKTTDGDAELAIGKMVLTVPDYFLLEKGLV